MIMGASIKEKPHQLSSSFWVQQELIHLCLFSLLQHQPEEQAHRLKNSVSIASSSTLLF